MNLLGSHFPRLLDYQLLNCGRINGNVFVKLRGKWYIVVIKKMAENLKIHKVENFPEI